MQHTPIAISLIVATSMFSPYLFAENNDDYLYVNGVKVELGVSQRYMESKFGIPSHENSQYVSWTLKNGNRLSASFDEYGLSDVTVSGNKPDFLYAHGNKITLGQDSLNSSQQKHKYGCYYQGWEEGWIGEYVVRSGPEGSWNLTFRTFGTDDEKALKTRKLNSISLGYDQPIFEQEYCTY